MKRLAAVPMAGKGSMDSAFAILVKGGATTGTTVAFKMYEDEEDFKTLTLRPAHHTEVHEVPRFYQMTSPSAVITFYVHGDGQHLEVSNELFATSAMWEPCKFALTKALASLWENASVAFGPTETQGEDRPHDWKGTVGVYVRHQLIKAEDTQRLIVGPCSRGEKSPEGFFLVQSTVQDVVQMLSTAYPQELGELSAHLLLSPEEKFEWTSWMKLVHDETLPPTSGI